MINPLNFSLIYTEGLLHQVIPAVVIVISGGGGVSWRFETKLRALFGPDLHVAIDTDPVYLIKTFQTQCVQAISNGHQGVSERMFAPIEPGLRDGMDNETATFIRYNSCTRIMTITFEA